MKYLVKKKKKEINAQVVEITFINGNATNVLVRINHIFINSSIILSGNKISDGFIYVEIVKLKHKH